MSKPTSATAATPSHRLVLEIAVPDSYVDGTLQLVLAAELLRRTEVGLTFVSIPGEIVGARIESVEP